MEVAWARGGRFVKKNKKNFFFLIITFGSKKIESNGNLNKINEVDMVNLLKKNTNLTF
jgi:hypothetical protein